jgi:hypothetical protein
MNIKKNCDADRTLEFQSAVYVRIQMGKFSFI